MGVVRDITVEQLAQAVGGIDTSGLVKDSTAQATNTILGNINTTLGGITTNDPPTDTTQQSIATAISALGQLLGSDKANISGDNIANKALFRSNIGLQIDTFNFRGSVNNWNSIATDCPLNEYIPLGLIGTSLSRSGWIYNFVYDGNTSGTYWSVCITASLGSTPSGSYSGRFLALKIN